MAHRIGPLRPRRMVGQHTHRGRTRRPGCPGSARRGAPDARRDAPRPGRHLHVPLGGGHPRVGAGPGGLTHPRMAAGTSHPSPQPAPGHPQCVGGRVLRPLPGPPPRPRRRGRLRRGRAFRPGRRVVLLPARRHLGPGGLGGLPRGLARRPGSPGRRRPRPRHAIRPVVRTRDGQPRLPAGLRPPRLDPLPRLPPTPGGPPPAGAGPPQPRGLRPRPHADAGRPGLHTHRLHQVGLQPRPAGGPLTPDRTPEPACADPRDLRPHGRGPRRPSRPGDRVVRGRRGPHRPGRHGTLRARVGLGLHRPAGAPGD